MDAALAGHRKQIIHELTKDTQVRHSILRPIATSARANQREFLNRRKGSKAMFSWRSQKGILESKIVARSYIWLTLIPIIAKLTSMLPSELSFLLLDQRIDLPTTLPFSWYLLYVAALSFTISRTLFVFFCPAFIRDFSSAGDAINKGLTVQKVQSDCAQYLASYYKRTVNIEDQLFLAKLLQQWMAIDVTAKRVSSEFPGQTFKPDSSFDELYDDEVSETMLSAPRSADGQEMSELVSRTTFTSVKDEPSRYYAISVRHLGIIKIEKTQLFKTMFWDFERFLDQTYPNLRGLSAISTIIGTFFLIIVSIQSLIFVVRSLFDLCF